MEWEHGHLQKVLDTMLEEYDVEPEQLHRDLSGLVAELSNAGLITVLSSQASTPMVTH